MSFSNYAIRQGGDLSTVPLAEVKRNMAAILADDGPEMKLRDEEGNIIEDAYIEKNRRLEAKVRQVDWVANKWKQGSLKPLTEEEMEAFLANDDLVYEDWRNNFIQSALDRGEEPNEEILRLNDEGHANKMELLRRQHEHYVQRFEENHVVSPTIRIPKRQRGGSQEEDEDC